MHVVTALRRRALDVRHVLGDVLRLVLPGAGVEDLQRRERLRENVGLVLLLGRTSHRRDRGHVAGRSYLLIGAVIEAGRRHVHQMDRQLVRLANSSCMEHQLAGLVAYHDHCRARFLRRVGDHVADHELGRGHGVLRPLDHPAHHRDVELGGQLIDQRVAALRVGGHQLGRLAW